MDTRDGKENTDHHIESEPCGLLTREKKAEAKWGSRPRRTSVEADDRRTEPPARHGHEPDSVHEPRRTAPIHFLKANTAYRRAARGYTQRLITIKMMTD